MYTPTSEQLNNLLRQAVEAQQHAYAPYSHYAVGCAAMTSEGQVFTGCNVENVSYGLTICAERNAIAAAVHGGMEVGQLIAVAIVAGPIQRTGASVMLPIPCGACLQVLAEFGSSDTVVICAVAAYGAEVNATNGSYRIFTLAQLIPTPFGAS